MGGRRWFIIGCYLAPGDGETIRDVEADMSERLMVTELVVPGDLNVNLERTGGWGRYEDIATVGAKTGLEDILDHFLLRLRPWRRDRQSWETVRQGRELRSWTDYILGSDCQIFWNMIVRYPRHNSDHFMVMGYLCGDYPNKHWRYLG